MWQSNKKSGLRFTKSISSKSYSNPFFKRNNKKNIIFSRKIIFIFLLIIFLTANIIWILIYSPIFKIKNITINLLKPNEISLISQEELREIVLENLKSNYIFSPKNNFFLIDSDKIQKSIADKYIFENILISKKPPKSLIINITEYDYAIIWSENEKYYYVSQDGTIISETAEENLKTNFPFIRNIGKQMILDNRLNIKKEDFDFIKQLYSINKLKNIFILDKFFYNVDNAGSITAKVKEGPELYFKTTDSVEGQIVKLDVLKNNKLKNDFQKKTYIDLRYGDMVYYK
jgi:cell division septal protein FtsQ